MKFYFFTKHKKVKINIIFFEAQTTQKKDDILKKCS